MSREMLQLAEALASEKNVEAEVVFQALEFALSTAAKKKADREHMDVRVEIDRVEHRPRDRGIGGGAGMRSGIMMAWNTNHTPVAAAPAHHQPPSANCVPWGSRSGAMRPTCAAPWVWKRPFASCVARAARWTPGWCWARW